MVGKQKCGQAFSNLIVLALLGVCFIPLQTGAQVREEKLIRRYQTEIRDRSLALDSIKSALEKGRTRLGALKQKESASLTQLEQVEENISLTEQYIARLSQTLDSLSVEIGHLQEELSSEEQRLAYRQKVMKKRLVNMYKTGSFGFFDILFSSRGVADFLNRVRYFQKLKEYDQDLIARIDSSRSTILQHKKTLEVEQELKTAVIREHEVQQRELVDSRAKRREILDKIREEKDAYLASIRELEQAQRKLGMLLQQLEKRKAHAETEYERSLSVQFEKRKGALAWPVSGSVARPFGKVVHPVYKTVTVNNGIDITCAPGATVLCVAGGKVVYIGRMRGLGRFIVVDHYGGYLTIYGNMGTISVQLEEMVEYGSVLGETHRAEGKSGHFHFEIRKSAQSLNPLIWLEKSNTL